MDVGAGSDSEALGGWGDVLAQLDEVDGFGFPVVIGEGEGLFLGAGGPEGIGELGAGFGSMNLAQAGASTPGIPADAGSMNLAQAGASTRRCSPVIPQWKVRRSCWVPGAGWCAA